MIEDKNVNLRDEMTGVKNKLAYVNYETHIDDLIKSGFVENFAVAIFDIHGVKHENDVKGLLAGDEYIKGGCKIICTTFSHSPVFRIGGDEFVAILQGSDFENRMTLMAKFGAIQHENKKRGLVTIAYGISDFRSNKDMRVQDVYIRADRMMNENKKCGNCSESENETNSLKKPDSTVQFYALYEQLGSAMTSFGNIDVPKIEQLLRDISSIFRLSKGITRVFKSPQDEAAGNVEVLCAFDTGIEGVEVTTIRYVTSVLSGAAMTVYMSPDEEPLSEEEKWRVELVMRTTLSFVARNRLNDMVDQLTYFDEYGYPNLRSLNRDIFRMIKEHSIQGKIAFRYNLRNFSLINQEYGREIGDVIMRNHFEEIKGYVGKDGSVARLGGDNFVAICSAGSFKRILPFLYHSAIAAKDEHTVNIQTKAGVFSIPEDYDVKGPGDILGKIINAYNVAKGGEKDHIVFYDDTLIEKKERSMRIQQLFPEALYYEEFKPYYQPKFNVNTGKLAGAEALVRWFREDKMIPPNDFVPILEETSDICRLDLYMLEHVCRDIKQWLSDGISPVRISVNFSRKHMMNIGITDIIAGIADRYEIPHGLIEIELTETTTDVEFADLKRVVSSLHDLGFYTSIDDFGMGFSSLNLIRDIPWDVVKIDRSFLPDEGDDENSANYIMYKHVVAIARELGRECLTEGTESEFHLKVLRENNCELAQGYYYDKPLPVDEFEKRLKDGFFSN